MARLKFWLKFSEAKICNVKNIVPISIFFSTFSGSLQLHGLDGHFGGHRLYPDLYRSWGIQSGKIMQLCGLPGEKCHQSHIVYLKENVTEEDSFNTVSTLYNGILYNRIFIITTGICSVFLFIITANSL